MWGELSYESGASCLGVFMWVRCFGPRGERGGTLNFVCCIGWAPASSVYQKNISNISAIPQKMSDLSVIPKKISADISIPKKIFPLLSFYKSMVYFSCKMIVFVI